MNRSSTLPHAHVGIPRAWLVMALATLSWGIFIAAWQTAFATFTWLFN